MQKLKLEIKTPRLMMRPLEKGDYASWEKSFLGIKEKLNKWDWAPTEYGKVEWKKRYSDNLKRQKKLIKTDGAYIGAVSLMDITREAFQNAYIGYHIFNEFWGQGDAHEAVQAVIKFGFKKLNLHRIEAGIEPNNKRSLSLAKCLKMKREGFSRRRLLLGGKWIDLILLVALSEDYGIRWKKPKN